MTTARQLKNIENYLKLSSFLLYVRHLFPYISILVSLSLISPLSLTKHGKIIHIAAIHTSLALDLNYYRARDVTFDGDDDDRRWLLKIT